MKKTKLISYLLVFALLFSALSSGAYAFDDSEDTGRYSDSSIGTALEPTRDAHLHFYFANAK
ncbi:MAG: hypothetical protein KBT31_04510, partial [Firmicutes bacterium]|nr:hypothetical protein [Candidatus Colimorpha enterica]